MVITTLQSGLLIWFLTPLMVCVLIFVISGGTYSLKSTPNDRFFEKLFMAVLIYSQSFCQRNTFCILFWCLAWGSIPGFIYFQTLQLLEIEIIVVRDRFFASVTFFTPKSDRFCWNSATNSCQLCHIWKENVLTMYYSLLIKATTSSSSLFQL